MGRNLVSVCDECEVQLMYLRGKESPNIMRFYRDHQQHEKSVRTISDYVEEPPEKYRDVFDDYNPQFNDLEKETK